MAIAVVLFFTVNVLSHVVFRSARIDLTEQRLYTLSEGSRNILQGLDEPVTLRFYLSKKLAVELAGIRGYTSRVLELLQEYEQAAGGHLILHVIDPEPFSEEEDRAVDTACAACRSTGATRSSISDSWAPMPRTTGNSFRSFNRAVRNFSNTISPNSCTGWPTPSRKLSVC